MSRKIRATLAAVGVAVTGLLVLAGMFGVFSALIHSERDYNWSGRERIELMPPDSKEFAERHFPGPDGKDLRTVIEYRNGDRGVKIYRADNTLAEWTITFAAGDTRLHAVYAKDGEQVVLGEQMRDDRTMLWKATNKDGIVTLTEFYYDGAARFSVVTRKVGAAKQDAQFFRKDGTPWLRQVGDRSTPSKPELEQVWDAAGKLVYERRVVDKEGKTIAVTYFRPDGTAAYKQTWVEHQVTSSYGGEEWGYYGGYSYPSTTTSLRVIEEYATDGSTVTRRIQQDDNGSYVVSVTTFAADGSSETLTLDSSKNVTHVEKKDSTGAVTESSDTKVGAVKAPEIGEDLRKSMPFPPTPRTYWKEQENDVSKRGQPAP